MSISDIKRELLERVNEDPLEKEIVLNLLTLLRSRIEQTTDAEFVEYTSRYFNFWTVHDHILKHTHAFRSETYDLIQELNAVVHN